MDLLALKALIDTEPLNTARTDAEVLAWLYEPVTVARVVSTEDVRSYLITQINGTGSDQRSTLDLIREVAESSTIRGASIPTSGGNAGNLARLSGARAIWWMLAQHDAQFQVDDSNVRDQFIALGPSGLDILTNTQLIAIDGLAVESVERWVGNVSPGPALGDVTAARAL